MNVIFSARAWSHSLHWQETDRKLLAKINGLIRESARTPFTGSGLPEPLRGDLKGWWSRRINPEHRLVYRITDIGLEIVQCRYHY